MTIVGEATIGFLLAMRKRDCVGAMELHESSSQ
jgi:hypothetical protein